jgi:hypothetical protein
VSTPAAAVVTQLQGSSLGLTAPPASGANLFQGPVRPVKPGHVPAQAVFCLGTGGPPPLIYGNLEGDDIRRSTVQVRVRSGQADFAGGEELARACLDALQRQKPAGFISFLVRESEPTYLAQDEQGCHEWSLNVECMWKG